MSQDKIAEHILTEDDVLHLVFIYNRLGDKYREPVGIDYMRRLSLIISKLESGLKHIPKLRAVSFCEHESKQEKGEIMKSIELSEEEITNIRRAIKCYNPLEQSDKKVLQVVYAKLRNAKPVEQKWSEDEFLEARKHVLDNCKSIFINSDEVIKESFKYLKTPKPPMRDRNAGELIDWFNEFDRSQVNVFRFKSNPSDDELGDVFDFCINPAKYKFYRVSTSAEWLPIPQIEKEK